MFKITSLTIIWNKLDIFVVAPLWYWDSRIDVNLVIRKKFCTMELRKTSSQRALLKLWFCFLSRILISLNTTFILVHFFPCCARIKKEAIHYTWYTRTSQILKSQLFRLLQAALSNPDPLHFGSNYLLINWLLILCSFLKHAQDQIEYWIICCFFNYHWGVNIDVRLCINW